MNGEILIVDDVPENLKLLSEILKNKGFKVRSLPSGKLVMKSIENSMPDIILLDVNMPEIDGYEVCREIKKYKPDLPVIFISAMSEIFDKVKGFEAGGVDYIAKPFNIVEVYSRIMVHLELKNSRQEIKDMLSQTVAGSVKIITELLSASSPDVFAQASRLKKYAQNICFRMGIKESWKAELAALLSVAGYITVPENILKKKYSGQSMDINENMICDAAFELGANLLRNIPKMEETADIICSLKSSGVKLNEKNEIIRDILKIIIEYDNYFITEKASENAMSKMHLKKGDYNINILSEFFDYLKSLALEKVKMIYCKDMKSGMILLEDIEIDGRTKVAVKNTVLNPHLINIIQYYASKGKIIEPLKIKEVVEG